ncbi:MAG: hypothetical protein R3C18_13545 [Planctomycetaceae bacterium]
MSAIESHCLVLRTGNVLMICNMRLKDAAVKGLALAEMGLAQHHRKSTLLLSITAGTGIQALNFS